MTEYEKLGPGSALLHDAVLVEITRLFGRSFAAVSTVDEIASLPIPVNQALATAEAWRVRLGLKRIVVRLEDEKFWDPVWGRLVEPST